MNSNLSISEINAIVNTSHKDPFKVLGMHEEKENGEKKIVVRAFIPDAVKLAFIDRETGVSTSMEKIHEDGLFEGYSGRKEMFPYMLQAFYENGMITQFHDSYSFNTIFGDMDLHLFQEGNHLKIYEKMGSHFKVINGIGGVYFAVWAPNALRVSVVGDFNLWDGRKHVMRCLGDSGIFEIFIPGLSLNEKYKYEIRAESDFLIEKSDPYAYYYEVRPDTASITYTLEGYNWKDEKWLKQRSKKKHLEEPMSIYEVHLGSFMRVIEEGNRFLKYRELADKLVNYVVDMGYTHVELMPVSEHPYDLSWGYQVTGYYAPTSRHGSPKDFMYLIDAFHEKNIGVILDWVPAHFPKDWHGLGSFDGTHLFEHADPRQGEHKDWNTLIFNYGRNEVKNFLISNILFWCEKYHIDGFRVDAVASMLYLDYSKKDGEWLPNKYGGKENLEAIELLRYMNSVVHEYHPGVITIAEESTAWPLVTGKLEEGGLGFDYKWNMGWMHDTLDYFATDPFFRAGNQKNITFPIMYAWSENYINVFSHDEVVHMKGSMINKMVGDLHEKFANLRLLYGYMYSQPGKNLLFMGSDIAQWKEWNCNQSLDWNLLEIEEHQKINDYVKYLNRLQKEEKPLHEMDTKSDGFQWIDFSDNENSVISYIRYAKDRSDYIVCVFNMTPIARYNYPVGVPEHRHYREILNSNALEFGGDGLGNMGGFWSDPVESSEFKNRLNLTLPPLSVLFFKPA